ncbi:hypothetical protein AgCh_036418 [Apium graveolens]
MKKEMERERKKGRRKEMTRKKGTRRKEKELTGNRRSEKFRRSCAAAGSEKSPTSRRLVVDVTTVGKIVSENVVFDNVALVAGLEVNLLRISKFADKGLKSYSTKKNALLSARNLVKLL